MATIGRVNVGSLRGRLARTDESQLYALNIPLDFLAMLLGFIDGDGYIAITKTTKGFISISLVIALQGADRAILDYFKSVLQIGAINYFPATNTVKYIINRTDLQEILFPLMLHHGLFFLTTTRRAQFDLAMVILNSTVTLFKEIPNPIIITTYFPLPTTPSGYLAIPFFLNWIVGFTIAEGSFSIKVSGELFFSLKQRGDGHIMLFEALRLVFDTKRKVTGTTYLQLSVSSVKDIQSVINIFSFSGLHPLVGMKMEQYQR